MSRQNYSDESNWKHEPDAKHFEDDKFGKGTRTRNWRKNLEEDEQIEAQESNEEAQVDQDEGESGQAQV